LGANGAEDWRGHIAMGRVHDPDPRLRGGILQEQLKAGCEFF